MGRQVQTTLRLGLTAIALSGCAYEAPLDPGAAPIANAISGDVVFAGLGPVGPTYVTVFSAANPGPPIGTGAPLTFVAVPGGAYTGGQAGLQTAPYALTRIPDGAYLLTALMDLDGDFNPFASALAGATCGDWVGAHLQDLVLQQPAPVEVSGGKVLDEVTVVVGQPMTTERPVFTFVGTPQLDLGDILQGLAYPLFRLRASAVDVAFSPTFPLTLGPVCAPDPAFPCDPTLAPACPCDAATLAPCQTALWPLLVDADLDGVVDPYPAEAQAAAGLLDVWPRVYLAYTGELAEFTVDGVTYPERWVAEAFPMAGEIGAAAAYLGAPPGVAAAAFGPIGAPFPVTELSITFAPIFRHYHAAGAMGVDANGPFDLVDLTTGLPPDTVPAGQWSVTLVSYSGQTWNLPNEAAALGAVDQGLALAIQP